jgi:large subunit ribosomal protein L30
MGKIKITQVKSVIDRSKKQKATMQALGLKRIRHSVVIEETLQIKGMVNKVSHLITVEPAG